MKVPPKIKMDDHEEEISGDHLNVDAADNSSDSDTESCESVCTQSRGFDYEIISEESLKIWEEEIKNMVSWFSSDPKKRVWPEYCDQNHRRKKNFRRRAKKYRYVNGQLYHPVMKKGEEHLLKVVASPDKQREIMKAVHEGIGEDVRMRAMSGHNGRDRTASIICKRFEFPRVYDRVVSMIKYCHTCQTMNSTRLHKDGSVLHPIPVPCEVFKQVGIDLIGPLPESQGMKHIVTCVDYTTKWVEAFPIPRKTALNVVGILFKLLCRYGSIQINITDQGSEFNNALTKEFYKLTKTEHRITAAYHPQTNGLVERSNRTIEDTIKKYVTETDDWVTILDSVLFSIRVSKHASTKFSPYRLLYGREPVLPLDDYFNDDEELKETGPNLSKDVITGEDKSVEDRVEDMEKLRKLVLSRAKTNIGKAQERQAKYYNTRNMASPFKVGQKVLKKVYGRGRIQKWGRKWMSLPYTVIGRSELGNYYLKDIHGKKLSHSVPPAHVKAFHSLDTMSSDEEGQEISGGPESAADGRRVISVPKCQAAPYQGILKVPGGTITITKPQPKKVTIATCPAAHPSPSQESPAAMSGDLFMPGADVVEVRTLPKNGKSPAARQLFKPTTKAMEVKCPGLSRKTKLAANPTVGTLSSEAAQKNNITPASNPKESMAAHARTPGRNNKSATSAPARSKSTVTPGISLASLATGLSKLKRPSASFLENVSPAKKSNPWPEGTRVDDIPIEIVDEEHEIAVVNCTINETKPDDPKPSYRDVTLDTKGIQEVAYIKRPMYFRPLTLVQCRNISRNVFSLVFDRFSNQLQYLNCGQVLRDERPPRVLVPMQGDHHCFFHAVAYLLTNDRDQHKAVRTQLMDFIQKPVNFIKLFKFVNQADGKRFTALQGKQYIADNDLRGNGWATQLEMHAVAQMTGKDLYCYYRNGWEVFPASGDADNRTDNGYYMNNPKYHFMAVVGL